jgi:hypothetical protein
MILTPPQRYALRLLSDWPHCHMTGGATWDYSQGKGPTSNKIVPIIHNRTASALRRRGLARVVAPPLVSRRLEITGAGRQEAARG